MRTAGAALLGCAMLLGLLGLLIAARSFYYRAADLGGRGTPTSLLDHPDQTGIAGLIDVAFRSRDGTEIRGWYAPSANGAAVVVSTGTSANRATMLPEVRILNSAGFGVLTFDWPGTGASGGTVDWGVGSTDALLAAVDWLAQRPDVTGARSGVRSGAPSGVRIGALGFSAGGRVTARVAPLEPRLRAIVLSGTSPATEESTHWFHLGAHVLRVLGAEWAGRYYGWPVGRERPIDLVSQLGHRPVLIIGGTLDGEVSVPMAQQLFAAAHEPKELWIVPGAPHGHYADVAPREYAERLTDFFHRALDAP